MELVAPPWRRSCQLGKLYPVLAISIVLVIQKYATSSSDFPETELTQGDLIIAVDQCMVVDGPSKGEEVKVGTIATCSLIEGSRVRISGPRTGWVLAESFLGLKSAEIAWKNRIRSNESDWNSICTLAHIQILLHKERAAYDTSRLLKDVTNKTPYMRVIIAVANIDSTSRKSQINALCRERLLDAYLSTIVLPKLIETNDCELAQTVVNSFTWKENQARVDFLTWVASVAYGRGELDRAVTLLGIALKKDPNYNIARRLRGLILAKQGFVAESNSDLQECIRRWPHDAAAHRQLGIRIVESANADIAQGLRHLRIALKLTPRDHSVHFFVGRRLLVAAKKTGRAGTNMSLLDEAAFAFEKACILTHHNRIDYVNGLCLTYVELGKHMQAAELIDTLYNKFDSGDPRLSELDEIRDYIATKKIEDLIKKNVESIDDSPR